MSSIIPWLSIHVAVRLLCGGNPVRVQISQAVGEQTLIPRIQETERVRQRSCYVCAFLDCSTWGGIWQQHNWVSCKSTYGIAWCIPAGKAMVPMDPFWAETENRFILGGLLNVQDSLGSIWACINSLSVKLLNCAWSSDKFKATGVKYRSCLKTGL